MQDGARVGQPPSPPPERYAAHERPEAEALLSGVQALVRLPMDQRRADAAAGLRTAGFITGYPGSPLAGYDVELGRMERLLTELGVVHQPALNEELAATAVAGSQLVSLQSNRTVDGVCALWYGKAPGLDRAGDAVRHGNLMGAARSGGVLVCVGDDPQAKSSSVPSTSEPTLYGLGLPVLSPADPQELLDLGLHGFALSRSSGLWVGMRIPASVADAVQTVAVGAGRVVPAMPELDVDGRTFVHRPTAQLLGATLIELERSLYGPRLELARRYASTNGLDRITAQGAADVLGIVASGPAYLAVRHALRLLGLDERALPDAGVRLLKVAMPYPLDAGTVRRFAADLREIVVVEDKRGFLELLVKEALYGVTGAPPVVGKLDELGRELLPSTGEVDSDALVPVLAERLLRHRDLPGVRRAADEMRRRRTSDPALSHVRGAYFCAGCPHNTGVRVPPDVLVGSGSGCHGLAIQMSPSIAGNVVGRFQMGGEGAMWNGMAPFVSVPHFVQNLGDGTFAHSGSQAIRASVAAGVDITYKLLTNSVVAMTGGQPIPGARTLPDLARLLLAEGVAKIIVTTDDPRRPTYAGLPHGVEVRHRREIVAAQAELAFLHGVTVLIHDQECAVERRRREQRRPPARTRRVFVNPLLCDGCGDCGTKSNCVSVRPVRSAYGERTEIHQESCNLDYTCLEGDCPAMLTVDASAPRAPAPRQRDEGAIPAPAPQAWGGRPFTMRITGVGGTGVVTTARIVATAAQLAGMSVRGLDQTGIAQKGGSVCSDLRVDLEPAVDAHRIGAGDCDLYLGCDLLVGADPRHLGVASPDRTVAVMSTYATPTGRQITDRDLSVPHAGELRARVERRVRAGRTTWIDAQELSRQRFGSDLHANLLLLGVACQQGALPLDPAHLEEAIRRNGVAVEANTQALRYGRRLVSDALESDRGAQLRVDHDVVGASALPMEAASNGSPLAHRDLVQLVDAPPGSELETIVTARIADLVAYQDRAYARRYARTVARCHEAERTRCPTSDGAFAIAVAVQLHRLMAYRDEYEIARLHRSPRVRAELQARFGPGVQVRYHLRPPVLEHLGIERKVALGRVADAAFEALAPLRHLRGTPADPFGRTPIRRLERELRDEYDALVTRLADRLDAHGHAQAVAVARLPSSVRGYGPVKAASIRRFWSELERLHPAWATDRGRIVASS